MAPAFLKSRRIYISCTESKRRQLLQKFISKFEARMNQVTFVQIISEIGKSFHDPSSAIKFYNEILAGKNKLGQEASVCLEMDIVLETLKMNQPDQAKNILATCKEKLSSISSSETVVFSKFYQANAEYRKIVGPPHEFYRTALTYLSYTPLEDLTVERQYVLATDLTIAAISSKDIFNFGEVLATPIIGVLVGTPNQWLHDIVTALSIGDIDTFTTTMELHREKYFSQIALSSSVELVKRKAVLLTLVNMAFERPAHDRSINFTDISRRTRIPIDQVEWLLMKALSAGLVKGKIDEVEGVVQIKWVQPRVLDKSQIRLLGDKIEAWAAKVKSVLVSVEDQTPELYV